MSELKLEGGKKINLCLYPVKLLGALLAGSCVCSVHTQENLIQSKPRFELASTHDSFSCFLINEVYSEFSF